LDWDRKAKNFKKMRLWRSKKFDQPERCPARLQSEQLGPRLYPQLL